MNAELKDTFGRVHRDLRISLTDRCSLRCAYCMPEEGVPFMPQASFLSAEDIVRVVRIGIDHGIKEVRLTGGEPLLRRDIVTIVESITSLANAPEVSMTTNGIGLDHLARPLREAGLRRVNISLDTLKPERFQQITRRRGHEDVLAGIQAALDAGLSPIKLNAVLMRGVNDDEALDLLHFAHQAGCELRFIEQMPLTADSLWNREDMVTADEIIAMLTTRHKLTPIARTGSEPAAQWLVDDGTDTVGIIASVTRPFCANCDRIRLTADGALRSCLFSDDEVDVRAALAAGDDEAIAKAFKTSVRRKGVGHAVGSQGFTVPIRPMSAIGG